MIEMTTEQERLARQALGLLELFVLNHDETEQRVVGVCHRALTPLGPVAGVCVPPRFVCLARTLLDRQRTPDMQVIAAVNFPYGGANVAATLSELRAAVNAGADEIDVVYPYRALLTGDPQIGIELVAACRAACPRHVRLTVTLESGELRDPQIIRQACREAIEGGADFIKSSTGKSPVHTTPQAARIMLESIAEVGGQVGLKVAGGIRTLDEAQVYLELASKRFGPLWVKPERMRLGASSLLDDLLGRLGVLEGVTYGGY
jgi:deoxyribose-phosphate aldolase